MGKKRLLASIAIGAEVGGMTALFDRETRGYTKYKLSNDKEKSAYLIKHPTESIHNARLAMEEFSEAFVYQAENATNALAQVENTIERVTAGSRTKRIRG
ncbi:hypothetical protein [Ornithinibacillus contaminans]|uniref:hypothetical protein n=1 Tax=Ornithinibacillus contaminans TaxID=694055 RepID=UPI00064DFF65|nr:hypothetical protein [Ornithinibacillus contaminans]